jgi:hypothetical protein
MHWYNPTFTTKYNSPALQLAGSGDPIRAGFVLLAAVKSTVPPTVAPCRNTGCCAISGAASAIANHLFFMAPPERQKRH